MFARNFPGDHNIEEAMYRAKFAAEEVPATAADTLNGPPAVLLAVTAGDVAMPDELVVTDAEMAPAGAKEALGPLAGAVKVTVAFGVRLPNASLTLATNGFANGELTMVLWPPPETAVTLAVID